VSIAELTPSRTRTWFRTIAIAEAISWAGLLIAMGFKYLPDPGHDKATFVPGMVHGIVFLTYVVSCLVARSKFGWTNKTTLVALASSIPPFFTYLFEVKADKRGLLGNKAA
jgi:integral membrane protein